MSVSREDMTLKVRKMVEDAESNGQTITMPWIVGALIKDMEQRLGWKWKDGTAPKKLTKAEREAAEEIVVAAHEGYRQIVGAVIRSRPINRDKSTDPQLVLPGYKHLQKSYSIERDGAEAIVATRSMTKDELLSKRAQLVAMQEGLGAHIEEIDRFIAKTWPEETAA